MTLLAEAADRRRYVPLETSERTLSVLAANLRAGRSPVLLTGPSGIGKTLLLHVLAEREQSGLQRVRLAESLPAAPHEVAGWLLQFLFRPRDLEGADAEVVLVERLNSFGAQRMLLLVDHIHDAPRESVRKLAELARAGMPALAVVVAGIDGADLRERIASLAPEATVSLPDSLPEMEIATLYATLLADPGLSPRLRDRLANVERGEILRAAAGLPLLLKQELLRREKQAAAPAPQLRCVDPQQLTPRSPVALAASTAVQINPRSRRRFLRAGFMYDPLRACVHAFQRDSRTLGASLAKIVPWVRQGAMTLPRKAGALAISGGRKVDTRARAGCESVRAFITIVRRPLTRLPSAAASAGFAARVKLMSARGQLTLISTRLGARSRAAGSVIRRTSMALSREVRQGLGRAWPMADSLFGGLRARRVRVWEWLASTAHWIGRVALAESIAISRALRNGMGGGIAMLEAARRVARRAVPGAAVSATALFVIALFHLGYPEAAMRKLPAVSSSTLEGLPGTASDLVLPASLSVVNVQVNAKPWARVRIDGRDLGPTPLSQRLAPGVYMLEARFPDGQTIRRSIEVSPERRFFSMP